MARISVQTADFDIGAEFAALTAGRTDIGGIGCFVGTVRGERGDRVAAMTLEHYPAMTERAIARITEEAERRWQLLGCTVIHRVGRLIAGENIVLVLAAAAHRQPALDATALPDRLAEDQGAVLEEGGIRQTVAPPGSRRATPMKPPLRGGEARYSSASERTLRQVKPRGAAGSASPCATVRMTGRRPEHIPLLVGSGRRRTCARWILASRHPTVSWSARWGAGDAGI